MAAEDAKLCEPGFWEVIPLRKFRQKDLVTFSLVPMRLFPTKIDGVDHVVHKPFAKSPGYVGETLGWYKHPHQQDNLLVFSGTRTSTLRKLGGTTVEVFEVTPDTIRHNGVLIWQGGPAVLRWEPNVFHRVDSGETGSVSLNFAVRLPGFDLDTEFDIYALNEATGEHHVIRAGKEDQS